MSFPVDLMHLLIVAAGVAIGAWALIALRRRRPRGRFVIFGFAAASSLFGCAALGGEVGLLPRATWFVILFASLLAAAAAAAAAAGLAPDLRTRGTI